MYALSVEYECIRWLREVRGINIRGDAWTIVPNLPLKNADIGQVLLFDYGGVGKDHGAEIVSFEGQMLYDGYIAPRYINVIEANYEPGKVTQRRILWTDPRIKGVFTSYPHP